MNKKTTFSRIKKLSGLLSVIAIAAVLGLNSCDKAKSTARQATGGTTTTTTATDNSTPSVQTPGKGGTTQVLTEVATVAGIRPIQGSSSIQVFFNENEEFFTVNDETVIKTVKEAFSAGKPLFITFNPWQELLVNARPASDQQVNEVSARQKNSNLGHAMTVDFTRLTDESLNQPEALGIINSTDPGLNNLIPDFTTAQLMFDYIVRQCCAVPGPYGIDHCISFQYCQDGCYARAHKMCWIINNRYKYGTKKIFSFANAGSDELCVQGQKWGGCCIRWWYHVAPLVTVQTPTGPKAYVFDPAMFNQPVLLATWLHAQENPACAGGYTPHVTMINVQPTSSYAPAGSSGLTFSTDPMYTSTNSTLTSYSALITCP